MISLPYFIKTDAQAELIIEDIGNFAIKAFNDRGCEFIIILETKLGNTRLFTFGPIIPDLELLPQACGCNIRKFAFNAKRIMKELGSILNSPYNRITQAFEVTKEEALGDCRNLVQIMNEDNF